METNACSWRNRSVTAFDGRHLFQIAEDRIQKIDPDSGRVLSTIPAPASGGDSGLARAAGKILRTLQSNRFVTGVTWTDGELWHATWENDQSELRLLLFEPPEGGLPRLQGLAHADGGA